MIDWDKLAMRFPGCEITRGAFRDLSLGWTGIPAGREDEMGVRVVVPAMPPLSEAVYVIVPLTDAETIDTKELTQRIIDALGWSLIPPRTAGKAAA